MSKIIVINKMNMMIPLKTSTDKEQHSVLTEAAAHLFALMGELVQPKMVLLLGTVFHNHITTIITMIQYPPFFGPTLSQSTECETVDLQVRTDPILSQFTECKTVDL